MAINMDKSKMFNLLQQQVEAAEKKGEPIQGFVKKQIDILKDSHDEFVKNAKTEGYQLNNPAVAEIEVKQYSAMKQLAEKIGLPVEEYDNLIKEVRVRVFGEKNYERFFGNEK